MMTQTQTLMSLFGVTTEDLNRLINIALSKGGSYADLYFEHSIANEISLRDGEVNSAGSHIDYGMGIRVLYGDQTGYAYTEITTMEEMERAAKVASQIASSSVGGSRVSNIAVSTLYEYTKKGGYYPVINQWEDVSVSHKIPFLKEMNAIIFESDSRVSKVMGRISDSNTKILFYNSQGVMATDIRPMFSIVATCIMESEGRVENGSTSRSYRAGFEYLTMEMVREISKDVVSKTSFQFEAIQPKGGEMAVVMGAGSSGILLHEAIGHAFEADFNRQNTSIFADKLGKKICSEDISVVDDGTIPFNRGSLNIDDEGVPSQKTYMVKNGILTSYLHDRISASYYKTEPTGNGRRESFRYMPLPRMRATYMENGSQSEEDIISSVKRGIFADNFSNGQVQIGAGDFTFFVKSGYMIENGKLTQPVKDINIIGNGPEALSDIVAVADNFRIDNATWSCGKEQYCAVSCGMPSVLVRKLTVGGVQ
ncbi:MAG TPA: peptidase U62 [Rikenellaceae bacterium]|nr:peptidase U62 [Rikenellaceae bacterium]HBZ25977.1 peptidase U62 [Rikenellaceae bacterium]